MDKNQRICVVGAGPGGLSVAYALKQAGYRSVTVYEKSHRAGGQVHSERYRTPDGRDLTYELCALQPMGSPNMNAILRDVGVTYDRVRKVRIHSLLESKLIFGGTPREILAPGFGRDVAAIGRTLVRFRGLARPGLRLDGDLRELAVPFSDWIDQQGFGSAFYALFQYSLGGLISFQREDQRPPALYGMKIFMQAFQPPIRYINGKLVLIQEGFQQVWERVAQRLDVRFGRHIHKIERSPQGVAVHTDGEVVRYDRLIVASQEYRDFLDCSPDEALIAEKRKTVGSLRAVFIAQDCPADAMDLFVDCAMRRRAASCIGMTAYGSFGDGYRLMSGSFVLADPKGDVEKQIRELTDEVLAYVGGRFVEFVKINPVPGFGSYFETEEALNGIYERSEARQGQNSTYFVGETLSCGTNALVVDYSYDLVKRYF